MKNNTVVKFLFFSLFLISLVSFGQKIKVKRGKVLINKTESALFKEEGRFEYVYSDLNTKEPVFKTKLISKKVTDALTKQWLEVSNVDDSKKTEVKYEILSFSLSNKKIITLLFVKKYKLLSEKGFDYDALEAFFNEDRPLISEEVNEILKGEVQKENDIASITGFDVDFKRNYIFKDSIPYSYDRRGALETGELESYNNYLGSYHLYKDDKTSFKDVSKLKFYDLSSRNVAIATFGNFGNVNLDLPFANKGNGKNIKYKSKVPFMERGAGAKRKLLNEVLRYIIYNGVTLGNQYNEEQNAKKEVDIAKYNEAMKNSRNVYHELGYYIDKNDEKVNGVMTIVFEQLKDFTFTHKDARVKSDEMGKYLHVRRLKDEGKYPVKIKARSKFKACLVDSKACFRGVKISFLRGYRYLEIVEEFEKIGVYKTHKGNSYYISIFNSKETNNALRVTESKALLKIGSNNIQKKLKDYLGKCYKPEYEKLNLEDLQDVLKLAKDYNNTCNLITSK